MKSAFVALISRSRFRAVETGIAHGCLDRQWKNGPVIVSKHIAPTSIFIALESYNGVLDGAT